MTLLTTSNKKPSFLKQIIGLGILLFIVFMIPITISQSQKVQQTQSEAAEKTEIFSIRGSQKQEIEEQSNSHLSRPPAEPLTGSRHTTGWTNPCPDSAWIMLERCSTNYNSQRVRFCVKQVECNAATQTTDPCYEMVDATVKRWNSWVGFNEETCSMSGEVDKNGNPQPHCPGSACMQLGIYSGELVTDPAYISGREPSSSLHIQPPRPNTVPAIQQNATTNTNWQDMLRRFLDESTDSGITISQIREMMQQWSGR